jgi:hypothetical protein
MLTVSVGYAADYGAVRQSLAETGSRRKAINKIAPSAQFSLISYINMK